MKKPLAGKTALVTGASSGIGLGIAEALAEDGADLILHSREASAATDQLVADIAQRHGVQVAYQQADLRNVAQIEALHYSVMEKTQGLDILVNNAGIQYVEAVDAFPVEKWNDIMAVNLNAAFHTIRLFLPSMRARGWGRILNLASVHGLRASPFKSAYTASKHALVGLTKAVGLEVAQENITCNAICPGYVLTGLVEGQIEDQMRVHGLTREAVIREVMLDRQPTKAFVEIAEIGALTRFLCAPAARSINGLALPVEGGWTAR